MSEKCEIEDFQSLGNTLSTLTKKLRKDNGELLKDLGKRFKNENGRISSTINDLLWRLAHQTQGFITCIEGGCVLSSGPLFRAALEINASIRYVCDPSISNEKRDTRCQRFREFRRVDEKIYMLRMQEAIDTGKLDIQIARDEYGLFVDKHGKIPAAFFSDDEKKKWKKLYGKDGLQEIIKFGWYCQTLTNFVEKFADPALKDQYSKIYDLFSHTTHVSSFIQPEPSRGVCHLIAGMARTKKIAEIGVMLMNETFGLSKRAVEQISFDSTPSG